MIALEKLEAWRNESPKTRTYYVTGEPMCITCELEDDGEIAIDTGKTPEAAIESALGEWRESHKEKP